VTVKLGLFTMPFHHPDRDYGQILAEDQEAIVLADRLGFTEAFVGEHFSSWSERITSPLIFFATLIPRTTQITFGTGVINLPQMHPAAVAAHVAMFDHLCGGRFIMGIGPGGLVSDIEMFDVGQAELRPQMVIESIEAIQKLWAEDPPYEIDGRFWKIRLENNIWPEFKVGYVPRPFQKPHPPIALSLLTPIPAARRPRASAGGSPSPASSSTAATSAATGRDTSRAARRWDGDPTRTSGASPEACSSPRRNPRRKTTSPTPTTACRSTTRSFTSASREGARPCSC
jgi:alkanesulfonate monooxygenase SsuD/methylene tetrahydromethanopterin reductase-like flavin-dependent oxidoreductase (luciferase family)